MADREPDHYGHETVSSGFSVSQEAQSDSLIFAYIDGSTAAKMGKPRIAPESLTEDARWCWEAGWDKGLPENKV